jgi:hypothetical protein
MDGREEPMGKWEAAFCGFAGAGLAGFLIGRFAIGPIQFPVGSNIDGYENLEWLASGALTALAMAPLGAMIAFRRQRAINRGR